MHFSIVANVFDFVDSVPVDVLAALNHVVNVKSIFIDQRSDGCPSAAIVGAEERGILVDGGMLNRGNSPADYCEGTGDQNPVDRPVTLLAKGRQFCRTGLAISGRHVLALLGN